MQRWRGSIMTVLRIPMCRAAMAFIVGTNILLLTSLSASASEPTATGSVSCALSASVKFSPPLTNASGGTNPSSVRGTLSGCTRNGVAMGIGNMKGTYTFSPFACRTRWTTSASMNGTIKWRRTAPTSLHGTVALGSYSGAASLSLNVPTTLAKGCASRQGLRSARVTGAITLQSVGGGSTACSEQGNPTIYPLYAGAECGSLNYGPMGITAGPDGALWFTDYRQGTIGRITTSGTVRFDPTGGHFGPNSITVGPDGALWFTSAATNISNTSVFGGAVGRITTSGAVTIYPISSGSPDNIVVGPDGALWFVLDVTNDLGGGSIGRITTSGVLTFFTGRPGIDFPTGITLGPDGALWYTNGGHWVGSNLIDQSIGRITTSGAITTYSTGTTGGAEGPVAITTAPDGALWFANYGSDNFIGRITTSGTLTTYRPPGGSFGPLTGPVAMTFGPDGALWMANYGNPGSIGRMTMSGVYTSYSNPGIRGPYGVATGPDGSMWFTNYQSDTIGRITPP